MAKMGLIIQRSAMADFSNLSVRVTLLISVAEREDGSDCFEELLEYIASLMRSLITTATVFE